ncbi:MAG: HNH endonuclease, partial [Victivallaceae bacterium]
MSSDRNISIETRRQLWFEAAGRCAICNKDVSEDPQSHYIANEADIAHIHDVNPKTHRYEPRYPSDKLNSAENLLLACKDCHRIIDNELEQIY